MNTHRRMLARAVGLAAIFGVTWLSALAGASVASAAPPSVDFVGRLAIAGSGTGASSRACDVLGSAVDSQLGYLILIQQTDTYCAPARALPVSLVELFSTKTMKLVAEGVLQDNNGNPASPNTRFLPIDTKRQRFFVPVASTIQGIPSHIYSYSIIQLATLSPGAALRPVGDISVPDAALEGATGATGPTGVLPIENPTGAAGDFVIEPSGAAYDPVDDALYEVLYQNFGNTTSLTSSHGPGSQDVYLARISVADGAVAWIEALGQCQYSPSYVNTAFMADSDPVMVVHDTSDTKVVAGCVTSRALAFSTDAKSAGCSSGAKAQFEGGSMLTYVIPLQNGQPVQAETGYRLGRPNTCAGFADPDSGRIFWVNVPGAVQQGATAAGPTAVTFDAAKRAYIGAPTIGDPTMTSGNFALATGGGKLFTAGMAGITVVDVTATPVGQGLHVTPPNSVCTAALALLDPVVHHLFVQPYKNCGPGAVSGFYPVAYFNVYQDNTPTPAPTANPDPDNYTTQIPEQSGLTTSQYSAEASAIGTRVRLVGGTTGALLGGTSGAYSLIQSQLGATDPLQNDYSTREVDLGVVSNSGLNNFEAAAQATVSVVDHTTNSNCYGMAPQLPAGQKLCPPVETQKWPFGESACSNAGGSAQQSRTTNYGYDTASSVSCDYAKGSVQTGSEAGAVGLTATLAGNASAAPANFPIGVGQSISDTTLTLRPDLYGLKVTSHSLVKNIDLGPVAIGAVEATTTCQAHGSSGTASCTYIRTISGVTAPGGGLLGGGACQSESVPNAGVVNTCSGMLTALNSLEPGILVFFMPIPDQQPYYFAGSPGGYQAVSQREEYEHLQDQTLNYDDSLLVPGLEMLYVNDSFTNPSRLDVQLANVEGESHYGIHPMPPGVTLPGTSGTGGGGGTGAIEGVLGTPGTPGTPPTISTSSGDAGTSSGGGAFGSLWQQLQRLFSGLGVLLRSPLTALSVLLLFGLLGSPVISAWRRSRLLHALRDPVT